MGRWSLRSWGAFRWPLKIVTGARSPVPKQPVLAIGLYQVNDNCHIILRILLRTALVRDKNRALAASHR